MSENKKLTTASHIAYAENENTMSGNLLLQDFNRNTPRKSDARQKAAALAARLPLPATSSNTQEQKFLTPVPGWGWRSHGALL